MTYQPIWRDGTVLAEGERSSDDRYELIRRHVYDPLDDDAFTVLDLGAAEGYFTARTVADYDAHVLAIDPNPKLRDLDSHDRVEVHPAKITRSGLRHLPRHDVVLALSVLHHFADWRAVLREIVACGEYAVVEIPDPAESWMRRSAARRQLREIHEAVSGWPGAKLIGRSERVAPGRASPETTFMRPVYRLPGSLHLFEGTLFSGSGSNRGSVRRFADKALTDKLGYAPYPGSLNVRIGSEPRLGPPSFTWSRRIGQKRRAYEGWRAWINDVPGHVIRPTWCRSQHRNALELWAPVCLRDEFRIGDGDTVTVDVEVTR